MLLASLASNSYPLALTPQPLADVTLPLPSYPVAPATAPHKSSAMGSTIKPSREVAPVDVEEAAVDGVVRFVETLRGDRHEEQDDEDEDEDDGEDQRHFGPQAEEPLAPSTLNTSQVSSGAPGQFHPTIVFQCCEESTPSSASAFPATLPSSDTMFSSPALSFESRFESGNLLRAVRLADREYDVVLRTDPSAMGRVFSQWYFFRVHVPSCSSATGEVMSNVRLNILPWLKKTSLYQEGLQPLVWSTREHTVNKYRGGSAAAARASTVSSTFPVGESDGRTRSPASHQSDDQFVNENPFGSTISVDAPFVSSQRSAAGTAAAGSSFSDEPSAEFSEAWFRRRTQQSGFPRLGAPLGFIPRVSVARVAV
jgi:hypothetical protein